MDIHLEFERRWKLSALPDLDFGSILEIRQGYIEQDGRWVRIRETRHPDGSVSHILCRKVKKPVGPVEMETPISQDAFGLLWSLCGNFHLEKTRHVWEDSHGQTWELDVYHGRHEGLVVMELELPEPDAPVYMHSVLEAVILEEITGRSEYSNYSLARAR